MSVSGKLAEFAAQLKYSDLPEDVRERATYLSLDAIGIAFASGAFDFSRRALAGFRELGAGKSEVFGLNTQLSLRDAITMNGMLVHGLDYDDTYLPGSVHLTSSSVPTALGVGAHVAATGREVLTACVIGLEICARLARAGKGTFQLAGFHPTGVCGAFAATLVAGKLMSLTTEQLVLAQGIALSTAGGTMEPMQDGSWTKRFHPGWAGAAGVTAATLAKAGFVGPKGAYDGRFGFFNVYLGKYAETADLTSITEDLGSDWQFTRTSIKMYPACHHIHAFLNATLALSREHDVDPSNVASVEVLVEPAAIPLICEPHSTKAHPTSGYIAEFSLQYAIACCLVRRCFGLAELEESAYTASELTSLAERVRYTVDPASGYPKFRTGDVRIRLKDGRELHRREQILPDEPASNAAIASKFMTNMRGVVSERRAAEIRDAVLQLDFAHDAGLVTAALSAG